jgi:hypothetical protein
MCFEAIGATVAIWWAKCLIKEKRVASEQSVGESQLKNGNQNGLVMGDRLHHQMSEKKELHFCMGQWSLPLISGRGWEKESPARRFSHASHGWRCSLSWQISGVLDN